MEIRIVSNANDHTLRKPLPLGTRRQRKPNMSMRKQGTGVREQVSGRKPRRFAFPWNLAPRTWNPQSGFTLLFAALISAIVLSLGAAIFSIVVKQVALTSIARESQYAFYAADTAAECALYWDFRSDKAPPAGYFASTTPVAVTPTCDGQSLALVGGTLNRQAYPYTLTYQSTLSSASIPQINLFSGKYCARITIKKCDGTFDPSSGVCTRDVVDNPPPIQSIIHADGYNVPCANLSNPNALQRSVELKY